MNKFIIPALAFTLTACGGGGSGSAPAPSTDNGGNVETVAPAFNADHLKVINADYAHNRSIEGAGVTLAIFDSGVNVNHDEFAGKTLNANSGSYVSAINAYTLDEIEAMGLTGLDLYQPVATGEQEDVFGHGTHVTSMSWGENVGVAPEADVIMLDVYPTTSPDSLAVKGLIGELASMSVDFINASLTGVDYYENSDFTNERPLYEALETAGMGFIVASGNFGLDMTKTFITNPINCGELSDAERQDNLTCTFTFDATSVDLLVKDVELADNFLWVGAVDNNGQPAEFLLADGTEVGTNVPGSDADIQARWISAPGSAVDGAFFDNNTEYLRVSGTSQAAPLVTGAAALVKSQFPTLSNVAVMQVLLDTANSSFSAYDPAIHGQGILDIEAALNIDPANYEPL